MSEQPHGAEQPRIQGGKDIIPTDPAALEEYLKSILRDQREYTGPDLPC